MTPIERLREQNRKEAERLERVLARSWRTLRWAFPLSLVVLLVLVLLPLVC